MRKYIVRYVIAILALWGGEVSALPYVVNNDFIEGAFPGEINRDVFSIPVNENSLLVIHPPLSEAHVSSMRSALREKLGRDIPFVSADTVTDADLSSHDLIVVGNISSNRCALALYRRRFAFADAYFPGPEGVIVHPASSIWNPGRRVIVVGVSRDEDIIDGFRAFVGRLDDTAASIGPVHLLKTGLAIPKAPDTVLPTLDAALENAATSMAPYWSIANWGLLYFITGDETWAAHFRDGMRMCYKRAESTGTWVTESWTNLYFNHWKLVYTWELLDDDPFFSPDDRRIIEEVLWGYTRFCRWLPNLDSENAPLMEGRQNHTTFLALSLYYSYRYYTGKYGIEGLEPMMEKVRRCFDDGQAHSFRPNDDAGNYLYLAPVHMLTYDLAEGREDFFTSGLFQSLADLVVATIDNRRDPVSFGDVGGYTHRGKNSPRGRELQFLGIGAWYFGDGRYQWLYNWGANERVISLDTMKDSGSGGENPIQMHFGADRVFSVEDMYTGVYAVNIEEENPNRFLGVFPVMLDDGALRWSARRTGNPNHLPLAGERYIDKVSYRWNFSPSTEYMLLDGISTFSHGHLDGNTISRLTWKDRVWLFDLDYIKHTPKYHNGVVITRDGVQDDPPPLTILDCAADFEKYGVTRTTLRDYNGADWTRNIVWRKGGYFLVLDKITAREQGQYRLESRWRTRGDVTLKGNTVTVGQGDASFFIRSADNSAKRLDIEPDGSRSKWNYPHGDGSLTIMHSRKDMPLTPGMSWTFASLMYAVDGNDELPRQLNRIGDDLYIVEDSEMQELIGLSSGALAEEGVYTDCALFIHDARTLRLLNATRIAFGGAFIEAPGSVNIEINYREKTGRLIVPEGSTGSFIVRGLSFKNIGSSAQSPGASVTLGSGAYQFVFSFSFKNDLFKNRVPFISLVTGAEAISPETSSPVERSFGIDILDVHASSSVVDASCADGSAVIAALSDGSVVRIGGGVRDALFMLPDGGRAGCMHAADIDGDGISEVLVGDRAEHVHCFEMSGERRWSHKLTRFYGTDANAADIVVADIDKSGRKTALVATAGWKLFAFEADGAVRWEGFTYYHPQTLVRVVPGPDGSVRIAVGTEYHTPLNVLLPDDGKVLWHVWEEMGSEYIATTEYCGIHLTDMVSLDGPDGRPCIAFGTKYNRIYSLDVSDGSKIWEANTGGEVTVMEKVSLVPGGPPSIVAGTDAGDIVVLNAEGKRTGYLPLRSEITDIEVLTAPGSDRTEIAVGTADGRVVILDGSLTVRAIHATDGKPVKRLYKGESSTQAYELTVVTGDDIRVLSYRAYFLKPSRHY